MKLSDKTESFTGHDAYYEAAYLVLAESERFSVAAKTPTLLLPQEQESPGRKKYFDLVNQRIRGGLPTTYLFSEPETLQKLGEIKGKKLAETLAAWREFVSLKTLKLGCLLDSNFRSMVFGDRHLALSKKHPVTGKSDGATIYPLSESKEFLAEFKALEKRAGPVDLAYLYQLRKHL